MDAGARIDTNPDLRPLNGNGGQRRVDDHGVGVGEWDIAGDDDEHAGGVRQVDRPGPGRAVIQHLVEDDDTLGAHRNDGVIGEHQARRAACIGLQPVARQQDVTGGQLHGGAIGSGHGNRSIERIDAPDGFGVETDAGARNQDWRR